MKEKTEGFLIVTGLYPNETDRKRSGTRAPLPFEVCLFAQGLIDFRNVARGKFRACFGISDDRAAFVTAADQRAVQHIPNLLFH